MDYYILNAYKQFLQVNDVLTWARWFESAHQTGQRFVRQNRMNGILISTIFLGIDHNFFGSGPPILWETMIFGLYRVDPQWRFSDVESAKHWHAIQLHKVKLAVGKKRRRFCLSIPKTGPIIAKPLHYH